MSASARANVSLILALTALALASYSSLRDLAVPPRVTYDGGHDAQLAALERRVDGLTRALVLARSGPSAAPAAAQPGDGAAPAEEVVAAEPSPPPAYRTFDAPAGITITADGGAISVRNTDPALTGQLVPVIGEREDGEREAFTIVVPAPS